MLQHIDYVEGFGTVYLNDKKILLRKRFFLVFNLFLKDKVYVLL